MALLKSKIVVIPLGEEATRDQAKSTEDIEHALEVFRDVANETNRRVGSINEMIAMLSERSRRLSDEIGRFRTD